MVQPLSFLFVDMAQNRFAGRCSAEMDVGGFPSHSPEQSEFDVRCAQGSEFNTRAVRGQAANDPAPTQLEKRIRAAHGAVDDGLVKDISGPFVVLRPPCRRLDERFGFSGDVSAMPVGNGDIAGMTETAKSGNAVRQTIANAGRRQEMFKGVDSTDGGFPSKSGECVHLPPETNRITESAHSHEPQPLMLLAKNEGATLGQHTFTIAFEHGVADVL